MVGAVSAADENVTDDNLEISDEEVISSDISVADEEDILEISDDESEGDLSIEDNNFPIGDTPAPVEAENMTMYNGDGSKFVIRYYDPYSDSPVTEDYGMGEIYVLKYGIEDEDEAWVGSFMGVFVEDGVVEYDLDLPVGKYVIKAYDVDSEEYCFILTVLEPKSTVNAENASFNCSSDSKYYPISFTYINGTPLANKVVEVSIDFLQ